MKSVFWTVEDPGRDKGKVFYLEEMDAFRFEEWTYRVFLAMMRNGAFPLPSEIMSAGAAGLALIGISGLMNGLAGVRFEEARPLLDEMLGCVKYCPDPNRREVQRELSRTTRDIEEVATLIKLRMEVLKLHVDFSTAGAFLKSLLAPPATTTSPDSSGTQTSRAA